MPKITDELLYRVTELKTESLCSLYYNKKTAVMRFLTFCMFIFYFYFPLLLGL